MGKKKKKKNQLKAEANCWQLPLRRWGNLFRRWIQCCGASPWMRSKTAALSAWARQIFIVSLPPEGSARSMGREGKESRESNSVWRVSAGQTSATAGFRQTDTPSDRYFRWHSGRPFGRAAVLKFKSAVGRFHRLLFQIFRSAHCLSARLGLQSYRERADGWKVAECVTLGFACHLSRHEEDKNPHF